jgi:hypothetical protein
MNCEICGATHYVIDGRMAMRTVMDGAPLNLGRVSGPKALSASTAAWGLTGTKMMGDSRIAKIAIQRIDLIADLITLLETGMLITTKSAIPVEMELVEVGTNHGFEQIMTDLPHRETVIARETDLLTGTEDGEKRTAMIEWEIVETIAMTEATGDGIETGIGTEIIGKNASLSGWTNQRVREVKLIPKRSFRSGKSRCRVRIKLAVPNPLWKKGLMPEDPLVWRSSKLTLLWLSILVQISSLACGQPRKMKTVWIQVLMQRKREWPSLRLPEKPRDLRLSSPRKKTLLEDKQNRTLQRQELLLRELELCFKTQHRILARRQLSQNCFRN